MTDFETRARAAGRAVREAVAQPPATEHSRGSRGPIRALAVAAAITTVAVIGTAAIVKNRDTHPASLSPEVEKFCAEFRYESLAKGKAERLAELAPDAIRADIQRLLAASRVQETRGTQMSDPVFVDAETRYLNWVAINCYPEAATSNAAPEWERFAPQPMTDINPCIVLNRVQRPGGLLGTTGNGIATIYGDPRSRTRTQGRWWFSLTGTRRSSPLGRGRSGFRANPTREPRLARSKPPSRPRLGEGARSTGNMVRTPSRSAAAASAAMSIRR